MNKSIDKSNNIWSLPVFSKSKDQLLNQLAHHLDHSSSTAYIFTPNPEQLVQANQDPTFLTALSQATWLLPDGVGLVWAWRWRTRLVGHRSQAPVERLAGREIVQHLLELAAARHLKVLLIGGWDYQQRHWGSWQVVSVDSHFDEGDGRLAEVDRAIPQSSNRLYWTPGYRQVACPTVAEESRIKGILADLRPDVVLVGFGAPAQEKWVVAHRFQLEQAGVKIAMVVGGAFDVLLGKLAPPPQWLTAMGGEWLYRLIQEPWRLRRQLRLLVFVGLAAISPITTRHSE